MIILLRERVHDVLLSASSYNRPEWFPDAGFEVSSPKFSRAHRSRSPAGGLHRCCRTRSLCAGYNLQQTGFKTICKVNLSSSPQLHHSKAFPTEVSAALILKHHRLWDKTKNTS